MSDLLFDSLVSCFNVINVCMYFRVIDQPTYGQHFGPF